MALHGTVNADAEHLWTWVATRESERMDPLGRHTYRCELYENGRQVVARTIVSHAHAEGALVLARIVLGWAAGVVRARGGDTRDLHRSRAPASDA